VRVGQTVLKVSADDVTMENNLIGSGADLSFIRFGNAAVRSTNIRILNQDYSRLAE
jgi:hypothetical protein